MPPNRDEMMPRTLLVAAGLGLVAALAVLGMRASIEASYRDVEVVLDGPDWETLAATEGRDPLAFFAEAHAHGATGIAVYERTLKQMAAHGELVYRSGGELLSEARLRPAASPFASLLAAGAARPDRVYVAASPEMLSFVETAFGDLLGRARVHRTFGLLELAGFRDDLEEAPLGYLPADLTRIAHLGLHPVLRLRNYPGLPAEGLQAKVTRLTSMGRGYPVVFDKTEVLGYERLIDQTAAALQSAGFPYARIEVFSARRKQRGEDQLADRMRPNVIRLFSLTADELLLLTPASTRDKFVLAARERNIRILYLRPILPTAGITGTKAGVQFLDALTADLIHLGLQPAVAHPLPEIHVPRLAILGVMLGALAVMALTLILLGRAIGVTVSARVAWIAVAIGMGISLVAVAGSWVFWRKLLALGTASLVPVLAIAVTTPRAGSRPLSASLRALWGASAISLVGGLLVAALLTGWGFMMAADVFLGVNLAYLVPVVLVAVVLATAEHPPRHWRDGAAQLWAWSSRPVLLRHAAAAVVAGVAAVILVVRSGNFGLPVPLVEERLRTVTENLLVARPRTKEFLIGHPALMLGAAASVAGWRLALVPLATLGAIGQAGIINSFAHIHTPLLFSLWRTISAVVLGSVFGTIVLIVVRLGTRLLSRGSPPVPRRR